MDSIFLLATRRVQRWQSGMLYANLELLARQG